MTLIALSLAAYKVLHIFGVVLMFTALGAMVYRALSGDADEGGRKLAGISHGVALILILITGFGALAKLGFGSSGFPIWLIGKLVLWLLFGGIIVLIRKKPEWAKLLWWLLPILGGLAAYLALYKPT
jgi:hypothetical protein